MKKQLNPTVVYILSILGLLCCCAMGLGVLFAAPAYFIANSTIKNAQLNPDDYEGDIKPMQTAKIVAIVILIINIIYLISSIYQISTVGLDAMMEQSRELLEQYESQQVD